MDLPDGELERRGGIDDIGRQSYDEKCHSPPRREGCGEKSGGVLLSQGVYPQVPSAQAVLTSVFGMGTGVTLPL